MQAWAKQKTELCISCGDRVIQLVNSNQCTSAENSMILLVETQIIPWHTARTTSEPSKLYQHC